MTKAELREYIKSELGWPYVKVELNDTHLNNSIDRAKSFYTYWATGDATKEIFFTKVLSGGERQIKLPDGIYDVIDMNDSTNNLGSANELFTVQNQMLMHGMLDFASGSTSILDYHIGLDYINALQDYTVSSYQWRYSQFNNTITLSPVPSAGINWTESDTNFILVRAYIKEGFFIGNIQNQETAQNEFLYDNYWIQEYATALAKMKLGHIRRKFANGEVLGNSTITLDGDSLLQEGKEDKERLEEQIKNAEHGYDGWGIEIG